MADTTANSPPPENLDLTCTLPDGRKLGYAQYGSPTGRPVLFIHGHPGSRMEGAHLHDLGLRLGARIIAADRPGVGLSTVKPDRTVLGFSKDLEHLTDHLKLDKYGVMGVSGGGPYALACAHSMPKDRLKCVSIVCGLGPVSEIGMRGARLVNRLGFTYYPYTPSFIHRAFWKTQTSGPLDWSDEKRLEYHIRNFPKPKTADDQKDFDAMTNPTNGLWFVRSLKATFAQGFDPTLTDGLLLSTPLGFRIEEIRKDLPVQLWYGRQDVNVPLHHGETIAKRLGEQADLKIYDETHASIFFTWREQFLGALVEKI